MPRQAAWWNLVQPVYINQMEWRGDKVADTPKLCPGVPVEDRKWNVCLPRICRTTPRLIPLLRPPES